MDKKLICPHCKKAFETSNGLPPKEEVDKVLLALNILPIIENDKQREAYNKLITWRNRFYDVEANNE